MKTTEKIRLASVDAREVLHFRFGAESKKTPVLFAHQNFKEDKIQWPEVYLPVDITVDVDPRSLSFEKVSFEYEEVSAPSEALLEAVGKCRKLVKKKILTSHYGCQVDPVKYDTTAELLDWSQLTKVGEEGGLEIYSEGGNKILWRRFEWLMLFFVDATQHTDITDDRWEYFVGKEGDNIVLGCSVYKFPVFPWGSGKERHRLAQFLTLPRWWGKGYAERMVEWLHRRVWEANGAIDKLTLEDSSEGMLALRNVVLLKEARKRGLLENRKSLKELMVSAVAVDRMIDTVKIAKRLPEGEYEEVEEDYEVRKHFIAKIKWLPEEVETMPDGEEKEKAKNEFFQEEWENYVEAALRAWKRLNRSN